MGVLLAGCLVSDKPISIFLWSCEGLCLGLAVTNTTRTRPCDINRPRGEFRIPGSISTGNVTSHSHQPGWVIASKHNNPTTTTNNTNNKQRRQCQMPSTNTLKYSKCQGQFYILRCQYTI
jgi:hypothetical protein